MSISVEQPCYTLIHMPQDAEASSEMKFKEDLEKGDSKVCYPVCLTWLLNVGIEKIFEDKSGNTQENYFAHVERREIPIASDEHHSLCNAKCRSQSKKAFADILGNCAEEHTRWQAIARDDTCV